MEVAGTILRFDYVYFVFRKTNFEQRRTNMAAAAGVIGRWIAEATPRENLGGHRASHKKSNPNYSLTTGEEGGSILSAAAAAADVSPPHLIGKGLNIERKVKIHECSICGSEFGSRQAQGGHMRKRMTASNNGNANKSANDCESSLDEVGERAGNVAVVDFDLPQISSNPRLKLKVNRYFHVYSVFSS
ncbi:Zinc finger protein ZAT5 [Striga hermonthica]|uniref:Zinc finger protein ZAT5 n=1 Tax=Striga hermonthica TaxID=68872 RepID=A0A9N7RLR0_STRHE|nr:Zinc finger protein ZAT5 [Striga hermonthica]